MVSTHSRRRFRDIAALVDITEDESEVTATTSLVQRSMPTAGVNEASTRSNRSVSIRSNKSNHTTTTSFSFVDQLKNQKQYIQTQQSIEEEDDEDDYNDEQSLETPHLSAFLLQQQEESYSPIPYSHSADTSGSSSEEFEEVRSHAAAFSSADLSMEAEAGKFWGGSTAQRRKNSVVLVVDKDDEGTSLFRNRFHDKLRSRFSPQKAAQQTSSKSPLKPKKSTVDESMRELVLNSTDSTDTTCTITSYSNRSSQMEANESSHVGMPLPIQPVHYDESEASWRAPEVEEEDDVPSWKLEQRLKMRRRMGLMEDHGDDDDEIMTPPRTSHSVTTPNESPIQPVVSPQEAQRDAVEESIASPPHLARTRSWRSKEFRRTFRHRAVRNQSKESDDDDDDELVPSVSEDEEDCCCGEECEHDEMKDQSNKDETQEDGDAPDSPVKRLRHLFEGTPEEESCKETKAYMDDPSLHEQRRSNHRVVNYERHLLKAAEITEDESEIAENDSSNQSEVASELSIHEEPLRLPPAEWWMEMGEKVDRYHRAVMAKSGSEDVRKNYQDFAETQNQLGRAMAVALYRGIEVGKEELQEQHEREMKDFQERHEQELLELRQQLAKRATANARTADTANRNEAFRQRWKSRMSNNLATRDPTEVASTVVSNMSCRELSVERYRARILAQMNRGKKASTAPSITNVSNIGDDRESDISAPTTASEAQNKENAQEIQRLLDELQQAERRQKLLEKQLQQAGVVLAEDIPYQLAKDKVAAISKRMNEIGSSDVVHEDPLIQKQLREEYFRLEKDMQKYLSALMLTDEFAQEQRLKAEAWEAKHAEANKAALEAIRKHMPLDIRTLSAQQLEEDRGLSKQMVQKFRRTNVLQLLRVDPTVVAKWHPSTLEAFRVTGLTLTERRAIHAYLLPIAEIWRGKSDSTLASIADPMTTRKLAWFNTMKTNFAEALTKYERHLGGTNGTPRRHVHSTCLQNRCNLIGNQCPVRANRAMDYFGTNLGFPYQEHEKLYEDPKIVVGNKDVANQKSPAQVIAEARGQPRENSVYESPARLQPKPKPKIKPPSPATSRPRHPLMAKGPAKPSGLLAAIAARRID